MVRKKKKMCREVLLAVEATVRKGTALSLPDEMRPHLQECRDCRRTFLAAQRALANWTDQRSEVVTGEEELASWLASRIVQTVHLLAIQGPDAMIRGQFYLIQKVVLDILDVGPSAVLPLLPALLAKVAESEKKYLRALPEA